MKIALTGAHFTPAHAVIDELKTYEDVEIIYFGRNHTMEGDSTPSAESKILPSLGVKFIPLNTGRVQRQFSRYTIPSLLKIPFGFVQALYFIAKEQPDVVLSFGGYVAVPVVIAAWLYNIPIIIHEQTMVSGLANTVTSWFADKIAVTFDPTVVGENSAYSFNTSKTIVTGNPIRREVTHPAVKPTSLDIATIVKHAQATRLPLLLITGGNQGSHLINQIVEQSLSTLVKRYCVIHQTGDSKFQDYERLQKLHPHRSYLVRKWIDATDMGYLFNKIDLCVSRAGANTLLELAYAGVPTLLVPIPFIHKNEQEKNAAYFETQGLATVVLQKDLSSQKFLETLNSMIKDLPKLKDHARQAKQLVIKDAAKRLALETILLASK